jgi:hypothetical protein
MRRALALCVLLTCTSPADAHADVGCHARQCLERVARHHCTQTAPRWCVQRAIVTYRLGGWQAAWMRRIPQCESGWNPYAYNGHPFNRSASKALTRLVIARDISAGLFEFKPSTWATTRYARRSTWSSKWQALAAAQMARRGRTGEWACR